MADNVNVEFGASTGKAESGIARLTESLKNFSEVAGKAFEANQLIEFGERLQEMGEKVLEFVENFAKMGEDLERATQILGLSAKEFQDFAFAVKLSGGNMEGAVQSMVRFEKNIADAARGAGDALPFFKAVGVSLKDLQSGNVDLVIKKVADSFANTADGVEKTSIALAIGGRGFAQMIPTLNLGAQGLEEMNQKLKETGDYLTDLQKNTFAATDDKIDLMKASFEGLGITLFDAFRPAIDSVVEGITGLIQGFNDSIREGGNLHGVFKTIITILDTLILTIDSLIQIIRTLWEVGSVAISEIITLFETLGDVMVRVVSGNWEQIGPAWDEGMRKMEDRAKLAGERIKGYWDGLAQRADNMREGLENMGAGDKPGPAGPEKPKPKLPGDTNAAQAAAAERMRIAQTEIAMKQKLLDLDLQNQRDALQQSVAMGLISEQEKFQYLLQYTTRAAQIKAQAIQQELQLDGLKESQKKKLYADLIILERQHQNQIAQIQRQAQLQQMQQYRQVFQTINGAFRGMIQGILQGTQTWKEAWNNLLVNLLSSFVGMLSEMLMNWIEKQVMMAVFGKTETMGIISGHAAEGAAAAYASTAAIPIVGPALAPGAAAMAYANIMAFNALPSYDVGIDNIPFDHVAKVHKGERVMTAGENETFTRAIRSMTGNDNGVSSARSGGGGDVHMHFHGTVVDGKRWFMDNKANIAAAMKAAQRGGDSSMYNMKRNQ